MHLSARGHHLACVELEIEMEMLQRVVLDRPTGFAQSLELGEPLDREAASQRKPGPREAERALQVFVGEAGTGICHEGAAGREHGFLPRRADWSRLFGHAGDALCPVPNFATAAFAKDFA